MATFKAKARAVELLGKGQIADLPTAITELWKNGYDAYASELYCKLFLSSYKDNKKPLFLLTDNGFGMCQEDILNKWFVLGTDSKARGNKINPEFGLSKRTPMGEKGIGRLSVSYLGAEMLMLSKKKGEKASALLLDWRILENYDFDLEDLNIPLFQFENLNEFKKEFDSAKKVFTENLNDKYWKEQKKLHSEILEDWKSVACPGFIHNDLVLDFCEKDYHGTSFLIFTPHDQILELTNKDTVKLQNDSSLLYLRNSLSGLYNDFKRSKKDFQTHFEIFDGKGKYDIIDDFFTREEMYGADHWLKGEFDENGFFTGEIRVFDRREQFTFRPNRPPGETAYGPFSIEWGAMEGNVSSTSLPEEEYRVINKKLELFGGLYVYRDDFRVLPYGRPDYDFLEFERRRSLGAGYYFFSHRRFIGYIDITRDKNSALKDKAGREGFIQNKAYREFKADLIEFFIDVAKRYLRTSDGKADDETFRQEQIKSIEAKNKRQKAAAKKKNSKSKKAFIEALKINESELQNTLVEIERLKSDFESVTSKDEVDYNKYNELLEKYEELKVLLRELKVTKPPAAKLTKSQETLYESYQIDYRNANLGLSECNEFIAATRSRLNKENLREEFNDKFKGHLKNLDKRFKSFNETVDSSVDRVHNALKLELLAQRDVFIQQSEPFGLSENDDLTLLSSKIEGLERIIEDQNNTIEDSLEGFVRHMSNLQIDVDDDYLRAWYEEQNQKLQEKLDDYEELAQLGISIEIIDHQFNVMYSQMNDAIKEIEHQTKNDPDLDYNFKQLKAAFQHLEGNYKLLKPLYRTSRRTRETITGRQIELYIKDFFESDFERYRIDFSVNNDFRNYKFFTYDSIIKPVFLNIINNANYWLLPVENRKIRIELIDSKICIMNSGEPIAESSLESTFTLFYTRKPDGRGIGLYLARKNLESIGYEIYATNEKALNRLKGACFIIKEKNS